MFLSQAVRLCCFQQKRLFNRPSFSNKEKVRLIGRTMRENPSLGSSSSEMTMSTLVGLLYAGTLYWLTNQDAFRNLAPDVDEECQWIEMEETQPPCPATLKK